MVKTIYNEPKINVRDQEVTELKKKSMLGLINKMVVEEKKPLNHSISQEQLKTIRAEVTRKKAKEMIQAGNDPEIKREIQAYIAKAHRHVLKESKENLEYVMRELIGAGVIEELIKNNPEYTDLNWNGTDLVITSNDETIVYDGMQKIDEEYISQLVAVFSNANNHDFTPKNPIFDGTFEDIDGQGTSIRINAVHKKNNWDGKSTSLNLRVNREKMPLTEENFIYLAPMEVFDLLKYFIKANSSVVIGGPVGTGKTSLQKLVTSFITFEQKIYLLEDIPETRLKSLFPDMDIQSVVVSQDANASDLLKSGFRSNATYIFFSELRGGETKIAIKGIESGHYFITTLHSKSARQIINRMVGMAEEGGTVPHDYDQHLRDLIEFGVQVKRKKYKGKKYRYIEEIVMYSPNGDHTIFKQKFVQGVYKAKFFTLPEDLLEEKGMESFSELDPEVQKEFKYMRVDTEFPENQEFWRKIDDNGDIEIIPVESKTDIVNIEPILPKKYDMKDEIRNEVRLCLEELLERLKS